MPVPFSMKSLVNRLGDRGLTSCPRTEPMSIRSVMHALDREAIVDACPILSPGYSQPGATSYDGVGDYLKKTGNFAGLTDGKKGTFSAWARKPTLDNKSIIALANVGGHISINLYPTYCEVFAESDAAATIFDFNSVYPMGQSAATWWHFLASWDAGSGVVQMYVQDADVLDPSSDTVSDANINYDAGDWYVNNLNGGAGPNGANCIAESCFHPDYIDISVEANRRKFINADLTPVDLLVSQPFGGALLYYDKEANGTNLGTGGDLTPFGAPAACGTHP